ncbi:12474_t:CDS:2, partial [Gigaspora margarita]
INFEYNRTISNISPTALNTTSKLLLQNNTLTQNNILLQDDIQNQSIALLQEDILFQNNIFQDNIMLQDDILSEDNVLAQVLIVENQNVKSKKKELYLLLNCAKIIIDKNNKS